MVDFDMIEIKTNEMLGGPAIGRYPDKDLKLVDADQIIESETKISILFDYPFNTEVVLNFATANEDGFTKDEFVKCVRLGYKLLFRAEKATVYSITHSPVFIHKVKILNTRPYGILGWWGNAPDGVFLEGAEKKDGIWKLWTGS